MKKLLLMSLFGAFVFTMFAVNSVAVAAVDTFKKDVSMMYEKGAKADYLSGYHQKKQGSTCADCHGEQTKMDDSETVVNAACVSCHGDLMAVSKLTKGDINPHDSHLGIINCTSCHGGHVPSKSYCLNCHSFEMSIPFEGNLLPQVKEDFSLYQQIVPGFVDKTDIVIVGAGGAGMAAAITAHDAGAKVIIIEKMPIPGGNTQLSAGGMNAALTRYQIAKNIPDSPEIMFEDTMKGGGNANNPELAKVLAFKSNESMEWLINKNILLSYVGMGGGARFARFHAPSGGAVVGAYLVKNLKQLVADRKIEVRLNTKAVKLLTNANGDVTGVLVKGKHNGLYEISAKAVIFTTGGFSANAALVDSYQPSYAGMTTSNQPGALGEGVAIGVRAGAATVDMKEIQIHPTVAVGSQILITEAVRGAGAIMVNHEGNRFVNELTTRDKASAAVLAQPGKTAYLIIDDQTREKLKQIDGYFHLELVKTGKNIAELAKAINVPADNLTKALATYNKAVDAKVDAEFGRADLPMKIEKGNFYAIEIAPGVHYTMGGLKINTDAAVINEKGQPIKGFFAAGEVTGGVHGKNRLGGNSISETMTFGRIAGDSAVKRVKEVK